MPLAEVDAHNIVPVWVASDKREYGARTIRKKIHNKLPEFLLEYPQAPRPAEWSSSLPAPPAIDWEVGTATAWDRGFGGPVRLVVGPVIRSRGVVLCEWLLLCVQLPRLAISVCLAGWC